MEGWRKDGHTDKQIGGWTGDSTPLIQTYFYLVPQGGGEWKGRERGCQQTETLCSMAPPLTTPAGLSSSPLPFYRELILSLRVPSMAQCSVSASQGQEPVLGDETWHCPWKLRAEQSHRHIPVIATWGNWTAGAQRKESTQPEGF